MLDLHAVSTAGSTGGLGSITTILAGGDGQTVAGVPLKPSAVLVGWGALSTIADTIERVKMSSQDQVDAQNGEDHTIGTGSVVGFFYKPTFLPYKAGRRLIEIDQNTGANPAIGFTLDKYGSGSAAGNSNQVSTETTSAALTSVTWNSTAYNPTTPIPNGRYAILGAYCTDLTNYGLIRFAHPDFKGLKPGFPILDREGAAIASAVAPAGNPLLYNLGYQFQIMRDCPVFTVSNAGSGLSIECAAITTDTPRIILNLAKVA